MSFDQMVTKAFNISSFTTVGHLLHINLRDHLLQHKHEIGLALLNKNPRALAVVNKINSIDNTFRNFDIEVIAKRDGCTISDEELMICEVNENKCRYKLDFSKVYWNSRLSTEHERIVAKLNKSIDIVFDLFAGVGPFAVPAAKAKCLTYANDLNPEAVKWLQVNMKRNKVQDCNYTVFNKDAKDFILEDMKSKLVEAYKRVDEEQLATMPNIHILMNLPAIAPTFLQHFTGLFTSNESNTSPDKELLDLFRKYSINHIVYCYCFLKGVYDDPKAQVRSIIEENFGRQLTSDQLIDIFRVRNVAPFKEMYRVDIKLDEKILFNTKDVVGIIKNVSGQQQQQSTTTANGVSVKRVSISELAKKRSHDDTSSSSETSSDQIELKKIKTSYYCSII